MPGFGLHFKNPDLYIFFVTLQKALQSPTCFYTSLVITITLHLRIATYKYTQIPKIEHTVSDISNVGGGCFLLLLKAGWVMRELSIRGQIC